MSRFHCLRGIVRGDEPPGARDPPSPPSLLGRAQLQGRDCWVALDKKEDFLTKLAICHHPSEFDSAQFLDFDEA